jgi:hypothetical protein
MHLISKQRRLAAIAARAREGSVPAQAAKHPPQSPGRLRKALPEAPDQDSDALILDRRSCARVALDSTISVRPIGGFNYRARLGDVSTAGCRVELVEEAELGEPLMARFPQLEPLVGEVRWKDGAAAGLEFTRLIHPAVFDALVTRLD